MLRACRSAKPRVAQRWSRAHVGAHHRARRASPRRRQLGFLVPVIAGFALGISAREAALAIVVLAGVLASRLFIGGRGPTGRATLIAGARLHGPGLPITGAGVVGFILGSSMCHEILRAGGSWLTFRPSHGFLNRRRDENPCQRMSRENGAVRPPTCCDNGNRPGSPTSMTLVVASGGARSTATGMSRASGAPR
jgi:hypothetical protein